MNDDFILRSGKYVGKTTQWLKRNDPQYLEWVTLNQPKMLVEFKKTIKPETELPKEEPTNAIKPNMNFDNEK
jgi:hypothetical protein